LKVILHADDLGLSTRVNEAIFSLMHERKLTSASILANGPAFAEAVRCVPYFPHCSFGVHLNITEFAPLAAYRGPQPLYAADGRFRRLGPSLSWSTHVQKAILNEWKLQVQRVREAGVRISHIDSHHHTHTRFALYACLTKLCREQGLKRVRIRQTFTAGAIGSRCRIDHRLYNWQLRRNFSCVDEFGSFAALPHTDLDPRSTVEIMLHPGNPRYDLETGAFRRSVDNFRRQHQCITYRDLP
jgi:predicted glycoside hydrolase/deacetylase ChbG (UPF0249 family)